VAFGEWAGSATWAAGLLEFLERKPTPSYFREVRHPSWEVDGNETSTTGFYGIGCRISGIPADGLMTYHSGVSFVVALSR